MIDLKKAEMQDIVDEISAKTGIPKPTLQPWTDAETMNQEPTFAAAGLTFGGEIVLCYCPLIFTKLTRDEICGEIAHEFGHIADGDLAKDRQNMSFKAQQQAELRADAFAKKHGYGSGQAAALREWYYREGGKQIEFLCREYGQLDHPPTLSRIKALESK